MIVRVLATLFFAFATLTASAATYYDSKESCEAAIRAGKVVDYKPTAKHTKFGNARIAGLEKRPLEGDACVWLGAQPGKRWVFLKQGTQVYTKGADVKLLAECQNDIFEMVYFKKEEPATPAVAATPICDQVDGCGNITKTQVITHVVKEVKVCEASDGKRFEPVNGECKFTQTVAAVSVKVEATATSSCTTCAQPVTKKVSTGACENCTPEPELKLTGKVTRTDGRCVLQVKDEKGIDAFIRFGLQDGGHIAAVRVTDITGNELMKQFATMVGYDQNGQTATAKIATKDCDLAIKAFSDSRALQFTAPKLGFKWCTPVGRV